MGVGFQDQSPAALSPGKRDGSHFNGGWCAPDPIMTCVFVCGKISPTLKFDPRTFQPVTILDTI
jgi:hypothetical protein